MRWLPAAALFALGWVHHGLHRWLWQWGLLPDALRGHAYNISGAVFIMALLVTVGMLAKSTPIWIAAAVLIGHSAQVLGCSALFMWRPWPILPGDDLCSEGLAGPLAVLGVAITALAVHRNG